MSAAAGPLSAQALAPARRAANVTFATGCIAVTAFLLPPSPVSQLAGATALIILLGATALRFVALGPTSRSLRIAATLGAGVCGFLLGGALLGAVLPHLGVGRPLDRDPLLIAWGLVIVVIAVHALTTGTDPVRRPFKGMTARDAAWCATLAFPPVLALVTASHLTATGSASPAIMVGLLAVAMVVAAVCLPEGGVAPPRVLLLMSAMATLALAGTFRGGWLAGFDIQHEFFIGSLAVHQARFPLAHYVDPYGGMLSLTVWPAELHSLTGMTLRAVLGVVPSLFLALCVLGTWSAVRERLSPRTTAALCGIFILGSEPLVQELPQVTRQCYALFFFTLLVLAVTSTTIPRRAAQLLGCVSGIGIAVTHYSSAYLAAGAVIFGCAATYVARTPRATRVLSWPVAAFIAGVAVAWGAIVARTGSSLSQVLTSIRHNGLQLFPGSGDVLTRWLKGASVSQLVNASVIRQADLALRHTNYRWMEVTPRAVHSSFVNDPAPTAHGVGILGPLLSSGGTLLSELVLVVSVVAVLLCVWTCRRQPRNAAMAGAALFFVGAAGLSRFSQTVGVDFGPSRVAAQAYLVFVVAVGVAAASAPVRPRVGLVIARLRAQRACLPVTVVVVGLAVATSTGLAALVEHNAELPMAYSATGEQAQRLITTDDLTAAGWVAANRPAKYFVQADRIGALALDDYGFNDRPDFFSSVDPIIVDDRSWVLAYSTNVLLGTARGGNNARTGVFRFPSAYFGSTRSVLFVTPTDVVYGPTGAVATASTPGS